MLQFGRGKTITILAVCLLGILFVLPNFFPKATVANWPSWVPHRQLALGLDLRGGAHLLLAMNTDELKKSWLTNLRADARKQLRDAKIAMEGVGVSGDAVEVRLAKPEDTDAALKELRKLIQPIGNMILGSSGSDLDVTSPSAGVIDLRPTAQGMDNRIKSATSAALETIRKRVDPKGTSEATIVPQSGGRILVQVPGLEDTTELKKILGKTARLTFQDVNANMTAEDAKRNGAPAGYKIYPSTDKNGDPTEPYYLLEENPVVTGEELVDAQLGFDHDTNEPVVSFRFNLTGARKFGKYTAEHVGRPFAAVLDGKVLSAPTIIQPIPSGTGQITGNFTVESATELATQLRSGSLPASINIIQERTVGPSLGADSISSGTLAGIIGAVAILALTIVAYGTFGIFAVVGLFIHAILTIAIMSLIGSTLTLPGIAGLVLGIAMAVDANVLIYERIREELRAGRTPIAAIDAGFARAFVTILDSQLTTLACAFIMFWLGSGPISGFAVTLAIGICTSIFSSVTVVRLLISYWLRSMTRARQPLTVPV